MKIITEISHPALNRAGKFRNPNNQIFKTKDNFQFLNLVLWSFEFVSSFVFRASNFISSLPFSVLLKCPMGSRGSFPLRLVDWPLKPSSPNWWDKPIIPRQKKNPFLQSASERPYGWLFWLSS